MDKIINLKLRGISLVICLLLLPALCFAKEINFEATVDRNKVSLGSSLQLALAFQGTQDIPTPQLPALDGFQARYLGPSTMMSIVNGKVSASVTHIFTLLPTKIGKFNLGPFKFEHNADTYISNPVSVEVVEGQAQNAPQPNNSTEPETKNLSDRIFVTLEVKKTQAYLNEVIPLTIKLYVRQLGVRDIQYPELGREGFSFGSYDKPNQYTEVRNGLNFDVIEFKGSVAALRTGELKLGPAQIKCNLLVRKQGRQKSPFGSDSAFDMDVFDDFFARFETYPLDLKSPELNLNILPLPEENKPADFSGALGDFNLEVNAAPLEVKVGDPVTLKMTVSGQGNFSSVNVPKLQSEKGFKVYDAQIKQEGSQKRIEQIIMPMNADIRQVPEVSLSFFDVNSGQYKTITRGPFPITILRPEKEEEQRIVEARHTETTPAKEEKLGRDIIYIKENCGRLSRKGDYLYKQWVFLSFQVIALLLYLISVVVHRRKERLKTDIRYARSISAPGRARNGLRQAKIYLNQQNTQKFYDTIFSTLQEYLGNRFHLSSQGITTSVIDEYLNREAVPQEVLTKLRDIFRDCDMARYAAAQLNRQDMQAALKKLEEVIDYFQRKKNA